MALETGTYISDLNSSNPTATDVKSEGDDHLRLIKSTVKTTFPNVTGAVTATHTELNLLDGLTASTAQLEQLNGQGAFISDGFTNAGGTVDAITADFTPDISLTDGLTVVVEAAGSNTILDPTFAPDGLTAKTIKKNGNKQIDIGDIYGAGHRLILCYDSGNDVWELLNPALNGVTKTNGNSGSIEFVALITPLTFETFGPTGSGATNIWTAMDQIPDGAKSVKIGFITSITGATVNNQYGLTSYVRQTGSADAAGTWNIVARAGAENTAGTSETWTSYGLVDVELDSNLTFEYTYVSNGTTPSAETVYGYVKGWN